MFKQKTAYEIRISDWSSDVCSSDLVDIAVLDGDIDVLLVETGKFGGNADLRVGLAKLDMRPGKVTADTAEAGYAEAAEDIVEQAVHPAVQRQQRVMVGLLVALGADRNGKPVFLPAPGSEITNGHDGHLLSGWNGSWPAGPPKRRDRQTVGQGSGRFAGLVLGRQIGRAQG